MRHPRRRARARRRLLAILPIALLALVAGYAYTATNVVSGTTRLGSGSAAISGFTITNVRYTRAPSDSTRIQRVDFDLSPAASTVFAKIVSSTTAFRPCALSVGNTHARCNWPVPLAPTIASVDNLRVVAVR